MPIKPHPDQENTWIIDYKLRDDERLRFVQVEFVGSIKEAMTQEKMLRETGEEVSLASAEYIRCYRPANEG
ncbi:MAG TPA: hypothetical protein VIU41_00540 [Geobacteraceae bacterium]